MIDRATPPRRQRLAVLATVFLVHVAVISLFLLYRAPPRALPPKPTTIALIAVEAAVPAAAKPPPPALPTRVAATFEPITVLSVPTDDNAAATPGASGTCSIPTTILDAVLLDPAVVDAIRRAPPETRSIAGALVLWNVGWNPATATEADPLFIVRANVELSLRSVADACLDEPVVGPRLLPIPDGTGEGTLFMVFGSGSWTWRQLLLSTPETSPAVAEPGSTPVAIVPPPAN